MGEMLLFVVATYVFLFIFSIPYIIRMYSQGKLFIGVALIIMLTVGTLYINVQPYRLGMYAFVAGAYLIAAIYELYWLLVDEYGNSRDE